MPTSGRNIKHRTGRPYRRAREQMFAMYGTVCHLCGHEGATQADHLRSIARDPEQAVSPTNMRPAHGNDHPCPTCGRACNQAKGSKARIAIVKTTREW